MTWENSTWDQSDWQGLTPAQVDELWVRVGNLETNISIEYATHADLAGVSDDVATLEASTNLQSDALTASFSGLQSTVSDLQAYVATIDTDEKFIWHHNSGNMSEMVSSLPLTIPYQFRVLYSVALPDLKAGDLVEAYVTFEVSNNTTWNVVMCGRYISLADTISQTNGLRLSEAATMNVSLDMHHDIHHDFASWIVPNDMSGKRINAVIYAARTGEDGTQFLDVEQGYGRLFVKVTRKKVIE